MSGMKTASAADDLCVKALALACCFMSTVDLGAVLAKIIFPI